MTHWKWINDNGDIYLSSKMALVILHNYAPLQWDIEDFAEAATSSRSSPSTTYSFSPHGGSLLSTNFFCNFSFSPSWPFSPYFVKYFYFTFIFRQH